MTRITEGHLVRRYQGAKGGRDAALLDIAQDHALRLLHEAGFSFTIENLGEDGRRGDLRVETPFGSPQLGAKVELARHQLSLTADVLAPMHLPIHDRYDFTLPPTPVVRMDEAVAEKLARYRRVSLVRDLYDLDWYAKAGVMDEPLVRRLWVLKVYRDIVVDGRGAKPIDPDDVVGIRTAKDFRPEDIGYLTKPVRIDEWIATVRARYAFLADLDPRERGWSECNERDLYEVETVLAQIGSA